MLLYYGKTMLINSIRVFRKGILIPLLMFDYYNFTFSMLVAVLFLN